MNALCSHATATISSDALSGQRSSCKPYHNAHIKQPMLTFLRSLTLYPILISNIRLSTITASCPMTLRSGHDCNLERADHIMMHLFQKFSQSSMSKLLKILQKYQKTKNSSIQDPTFLRRSFSPFPPSLSLPLLPLPLSPLPLSPLPPSSLPSGGPKLVIRDLVPPSRRSQPYSQMRHDTLPIRSMPMRRPRSSPDQIPSLDASR